MSSSFIPVNEPLLDGNELEYVTDCIESGWISSEGPYVEKFEQALAKRVGRSYGIAVSSGSAALEIAIASLNLGPGDEVILPTHTIISCAAAIVKTGARPVLVDSDAHTWNMDVEAVRHKISAQTKAIMIVHIFSLPVDLQPLLDLAQEHGLFVIEDAAQMIGQNYRGNPCGSFGDISVFSFYPNKHVTTGEGGMVLTNSEHLAERARGLRNLCFQPDKRFVHEELGWNYRLSNVHAAIGLAQVETLDRHVELKKKMGVRYRQLLEDIPGIFLPPCDQEYADNIYWVFGILLGDIYDNDASVIMQQLAEAGVGTRPFFWPMHEQPVFTGEAESNFLPGNMTGLFTGEHYPVAENLARRGLYLPGGLALTTDQQDSVVETLRRVLAKNAVSV